MVTCRCGCEFENPYGTSYVMCPKCHRVYPNVAPNMLHPKTEEECAWECIVCGTENPNSHASAPCSICRSCGAKRPGKPSDWYMF